MMNINEMVTDCLVMIFKRLPLQDLVNLRVVCRQWRQIIETSICRRKRSLKLFGSRKNIRDYRLRLICDNAFDRRNRNGELRRTVCDAGSACDYNIMNDDDDDYGDDEDEILILDTLRFVDEPSMFDCWLPQLFPAIERLCVHFYRDAPFDHIDHFLRRCRHLIELTLCGSIMQPNAVATEKLCSAIDTLPRLRALDLLVDDLFLLSDHEHSLQIVMPSAFRRLHRFSLCNYRGDIEHVIAQLDRAKCTELRIDMLRSAHNIDALRQMMANMKHIDEKNQRNLRHNLTHLRISLPEFDRIDQLLISICDTFSRLRYLDIQCCSFVNFKLIILDSTFITTLNQLPQLIELRMSHVTADPQLLNKESHGQFSEISQITALNTLFLSQIADTQFVPSEMGQSIEIRRKSTSLYIRTDFDDEPLWRLIAYIFPHLEQLHVRVPQSVRPKAKQIVDRNFANLKLCRIYSAEDLFNDEDNNHHQSNGTDNHNNSGILYAQQSSLEKIGERRKSRDRFFSESYFDRIKDL